MESNLWNKYETERETERETDGQTERPRVAVVKVDKDLINFHVCFLIE